MVLWVTKIKGAEEHGLLQMITQKVWHPPCFSISLQMVICKEDGSLDNQNQGVGGAGIVANDHLDDLAHSVPFLCKWSFAKRTVLRMTNIFLVSSNGPTVQELEQSDR